jgi:hypothetical protein
MDEFVQLAPNNSMDPGGAFMMTGALVVADLTAQSAFNFTYQATSSGASGTGTYADYFPAFQTTCAPASTPQSGGG